MRHRPAPPGTHIVGAAILWGLIGPFSVWAGRQGLDAIEIAFWRTAISALPFALLAGLGSTRPRLGDLTGIGLFGLVGIAGMYAAFFTAVQHVGAGIAAVLLYTGPAWVALFEWATRREQANRTTVVALFLTLGGVALLSLDPARVSHADWYGLAAGLVSGITYATHYTLARGYLIRLSAPLVYAIAMIVAAVVLAPIATPTLPPREAAFPLLFLSLGATFAASLLFARGVVQIAPVRAAILATIEPVVATLVAILILRESFRPVQLIGAALVLVGVTAIVTRRSARG